MEKLVKMAGFLLACMAGLLASMCMDSAQASDSIIQVTAEAQGLNLVLPDGLPRYGTFWLATSNSGSMPPLPCPPPDSAQPVYQMADGQFLVDATDGQVAINPHGTKNTIESALTAQAAAVVDLINRVQDSEFNRSFAMEYEMLPPGFDDSGTNRAGTNTYTFNSSGLIIDTNGLWLEITNVSNGWSYLNLNNGTNQVYAIWATTNLLAGWQVKMELWPTSGMVMPTVTPFAVQNLNRQNLFLRAEDWTGVDGNGDGIPDWWIWMYFGNLSETATNLDSQGDTLLHDYLYGLDPNVISFTFSSTNEYVNDLGAPVQLSVTAGVPAYFAVLVDNTNYDEASWMSYASSNIIINLGLTQGWHYVNIGLRGLPSNAYQTWQTTRFKLDLTPPFLAITNLTPGTVIRPIIQLQGYCPEALASVSYDLTNAAGLVTNQQTLVLGQYYDANTLEFTTNYFQCFDVHLSNGLNTITIHATDLAGNTTTTNFNFILDYSGVTNPPAVQIDWPQAGTKVSGSSFTCRGHVSDPTAQVTAQIVATNGSVNYANGRVDRDGNFWIEDLPLSGGANNMTLTVVDAAGNINTTTIPVVQSSLVLTVTSFGLGQAVTGTISDTNYTIWVNGVKAINNLNGTWTALHPHLTLDSPTLQVRAIPNSDNGGNGGGQ